jgi:chromate transporter
MTKSNSPSSLAEVAAVFLKLGVTSFGGPVAHLGYFHEEIVRRRRWLDEADYADLVALCNFLPGPASSQVVFALGMRRAGLPGAFTASACFTLPSAVLLILFAYGVTAVGDLRAAGWLHGLKLAAVGVVAQAVWNLGRKLCPDRARITLALGAAGAVLVLPGAASQIGAIAAGALAGWWIYRGAVADGNDSGTRIARHHLWAAGTLVAFSALLLLLPGIVAATHSKPLAVFDSFYRAGSLVFGGGHVVLPLLRAEVVPPGWVTDDAFLAGYGAAQAVPGPLFTFSAYLGTLIRGGADGWLGGLGCLFAIFLPAWMLIGGALPFWHLLRSRRWTQAALRGANAAVVGVLFAALYNPVWTQGVTNARDVAAAIGAFALLEIWRVPPWLVVALAAVAGPWLV